MHKITAKTQSMHSLLPHNPAILSRLHRPTFRCCVTWVTSLHEMHAMSLACNVFLTLIFRIWIRASLWSTSWPINVERSHFVKCFPSACLFLSVSPSASYSLHWAAACPPYKPLRSIKFHRIEPHCSPLTPSCHSLLGLIQPKVNLIFLDC